jgi:integrase
VRSLRVEDVEAAFDLLAAEGLVRASLVKLRSALNQVLAFGVRRGLAPRNIALEVILPSAATGRSKRSSLDVDQVRVLLDALRGERLGAMFALSVTVGLRPGEAAGLTWRAVDLSSRTIRVASAVRLDGSRPLVVEDLKTNASARTLAIPSLVVDMLQNHSAQQRLEQATAESWQQPQLVFTTRAGTPLSPSNVRRELDRVLRKAGLPRISPNELRHTAASVLSDQGVPLEDIADVLGHTNTRMLSQTYRHQLKPSVGAAAAAMDRLFDGRGT